MYLSHGMERCYRGFCEALSRFSLMLWLTSRSRYICLITQHMAVSALSPGIAGRELLSVSKFADAASFASNRDSPPFVLLVM
jgi:hypothetical protein